MLTANIAFAQVPPTAKGSRTTSNGCVSGNCVNGKGKKTYDNGNNYEGDFVDGKEDGQGTLTYVEGSYYVGKFKKGTQNGKGKIIFYDGDIYEGDFVNDKFEGQGTLTLKDGSYHIGGFKNDNKNGYGKEYDESKKLVREGTWKDDVFVSSTTGVLVPTARPTVTNQTGTSANPAANETATLLRQTLNGKFDIMEGKPLTYVLTMKKSSEIFFYKIEFINDGEKLAFKWKETTKNEESEKLVITDTALSSAISYVNFFTKKSGVLPIAVITFVLSRFQYDDLKRNESIRLKLGNEVESLIFKKKLFLPMKNYASNAELLDLQTANGQTKMQILDNPVCPLIVSIETTEYRLELQ